jgi:Protein of unknown function DUF262
MSAARLRIRLVGNVMAFDTVNLDALLRRQDMGAGENRPPQTVGNIKHTELVSGSNTYSVLCKPDFQRETSIWTPDKVRDLILAYVNEDLVPAIILWRSPSNDLFVIDGAHRLSSIIAWVNNDYGAGTISNAFFGEMPKTQKDAAKKTKELVEEAVGAYSDISSAFTTPNTPQRYIEIAKRLVNCSIKVQPLETPDVEKAERSFFKINQQGVPLTETEQTLLRSRNCPNAIAARAINQRGTGHPHWKKFGDAAKAEIEKLAQDLHGHFFSPALEMSTIKTSILPIGGRYSPATSLELLLNAINLANKVEEGTQSQVPPDTDGTKTIEFLKRTRGVIIRMSNRIDTDYMKSLDLHPLVYFYSDTGRHIPSSFLAIVEFIRDYAEPDRFKDFTKVRKPFEEFLVEHKDFFRQIVIKTRGGKKAVRKMKEFFLFLVEQCETVKSSKETVEALQVSPDFSFLKLPSPREDEVGADLSPAVKSKVIIREKLAQSSRCWICNARVPDQGISIDHKQDKEFGGLAEPDNLGPSHHYCNASKRVLLPMFSGEATTQG